MNTIMILSLLVHETHRKIKPLEREVPETPESLVLLVPCYNENQEEITRFLESLHEQQKIEDHQQCIFIICDGRARGPGMD
ncbi:hypothetical protein CLAFUW4_14541 [Fulvia fulva]|uniref:Chitin synthase n=1 Tax=Passalora fulva TaxID=5499 RepID=A0A9Q8UWN3_PASFU|nr:uncharacterized protein CLAFUR5_14372 [Fulvia fulva]KAK4609142.1 hypothetical protein CLAFUR4_14535 [Fulvia fulva]KAK4609696.1 hypothetical protein CLAFUR0_14535 [Fulvia fulva]UJO25196.1 hypothetical protein CLAFUR5_14372 [Fulvia fulva]WPV22471.1 hypothetical protein CLAFUW4_14541 [Fulvia fulva]WPV37829.1 hypothetical protein CLAFUW7_14544 [Fulvia fulva]